MHQLKQHPLTGNESSEDVRQMSLQLRVLLSHESSLLHNFTLTEIQENKESLLNSGVSLLVNRKAWRDMTPSAQRNTSTTLLDALEGLSLQVGDRMLLEEQPATNLSRFESALIGEYCALSQR